MIERRVIVLGSINLDLQLVVAGLPAPGETVRSLATRRGLGGKGANQAIAASRAGAAALLIGAVGNEPGIVDRIRRAAPDLDLAGVAVEPDCETGAAYILVSRDGENQIVIVDGANQRLRDHGTVQIAPGDICVAQLEVPIAAIAGFFEAARRAAARTVPNVAPACDDAAPLLDSIDVLIVNETELAYFAGARGVSGNDPDGCIALARGLRRRDDQTIIVTLGANGLAVVASDSVHLPARPVPVIDTTGAGDCFCGAFCAGLARGLDDVAAAAWANRAASLQIGRAGAADAMPWGYEIDAGERA